MRGHERESGVMGEVWDELAKQAPMLCAFIGFAAWMVRTFLSHITSERQAREQLEEHRLATQKEIADDCHQVQRESNQCMAETKVVLRDVKDVLERMDKKA